jgi:hypothetical protein
MPHCSLTGNSIKVVRYTSVGVDMDALTILHSSRMPPLYGSIGCLQDVVEGFDIVGNVLALGHDEAVGLQTGWYASL